MSLSRCRSAQTPHMLLVLGALIHSYLRTAVRRFGYFHPYIALGHCQLDRLEPHHKSVASFQTYPRLQGIVRLWQNPNDKV